MSDNKITVFFFILFISPLDGTSIIRPLPFLFLPAPARESLVNIVISTEKETQEKTCFNVCGESRKRLVNRLSNLTGVKATYLGYPSMAFAVGDLIVERDGTVEGKLSKRVLKALERSGFRIGGQ